MLWREGTHLHVSLIRSSAAAAKAAELQALLGAGVRESNPSATGAARSGKTATLARLLEELTSTLAPVAPETAALAANTSLLPIWQQQAQAERANAAAPFVHPRRVPSKGDPAEHGLQEVALQALDALCTAARAQVDAGASGASSMAEAMEDLSGLLSGLAPQALYSEWSPAPLAPEVPLPLSSLDARRVYASAGGATSAAALAQGIALTQLGIGAGVTDALLPSPAAGSAPVDVTLADGRVITAGPGGVPSASLRWPTAEGGWVTDVKRDYNTSATGSTTNASASSSQPIWGVTFPAPTAVSSLRIHWGGAAPRFVAVEVTSDPLPDPLAFASRTPARLRGMRPEDAPPDWVRLNTPAAAAASAAASSVIVSTAMDASGAGATSAPLPSLTGAAGPAADGTVPGATVTWRRVFKGAVSAAAATPASQAARVAADPADGGVVQVPSLGPLACASDEFTSTGPLGGVTVIPIHGLSDACFPRGAAGAAGASGAGAASAKAGGSEEASSSSSSPADGSDSSSLLQRVTGIRLILLGGLNAAIPEPAASVAGAAAAGGAKGVGIAAVQVMTHAAAGSMASASPLQILTNIQSWAHAVAAGSRSTALASTAAAAAAAASAGPSRLESSALSASLQVAMASASQAALLRYVNALLWTPTPAAGAAASSPAVSSADAAAAAAAASSRAMELARVWEQPLGRDHGAVVRDSLAALSAARLPAARAFVTTCLAARGALKTSGANLPPAIDLRWDPSDCSAGSGSALELSQGGKCVRTPTSSNSLAIATAGFSDGFASWTMRLDDDSNGGECSCFGAAWKPVESREYNSSSVAMYRCYNGEPRRPNVLTLQDNMLTLRLIFAGSSCAHRSLSLAIPSFCFPSLCDYLIPSFLPSFLPFISSTLQASYTAVAPSPTRGPRRASTRRTACAATSTPTRARCPTQSSAPARAWRRRRACASRVCAARRCTLRWRSTHPAARS